MANTVILNSRDLLLQPLPDLDLVNEQSNLIDQEKEIRQIIKADLRISFPQNVVRRAEAWYNQLDSRKRQEWSLIREAFLARFQVPVIANILQKRLVQMSQGPTEPIAEYLQRADDFITRHGEEKPDFGFKVMEGLSDESKRETPCT